MTAWLRPALAAVRARRGRALLRAAGTAAAATMIGTAVTVSFGLATGFDRAAERAGSPDVVARFDPEPLPEVKRRVRALPNVEASSYRLELEDVFLSRGDDTTGEGTVHVVGEGRRGYAVVEGHDLSERPGEVVIERGLATEWDVSVGETLTVEGMGALRVAGVTVSPDEVAFPLARSPRVYVAERTARATTDSGRSASMALVWAEDPGRLLPLLVQARATSFGLENLSFLTREGVRALVEQAAGIVIALLVAFSLLTLAATALMLAASARAEVERSLEAIGVMRAVGVTRSGVVARYSAEAALVAVPAAALGLAAGALVAAPPSARLLEVLNEMPPGRAVVLPLAGALLGIAVVVVAATGWPAWQAASRRPAEILRGAEIGAPLRRRLPAGPFWLGVRLALARRTRTVATAAGVGAVSGVLLLLLTLASFLDRLETDPGVVGKRYSLTAEAPASLAAEASALPGVDAAAPRYTVDGVAAFSLGQPVRLIAFPGDHTVFEAPPLASGTRLGGARDAEVGVGLAEALGLRPGTTLAVQLPAGEEVRFHVTGVVRAVENEGLVAYVRPRRLLAAEPSVKPTIAVRLAEGATPAAVSDDLRRLGATPASVAGPTPRDQSFLGVLAGLLRAVAAVTGLLSLYLLAQAITVTAVERRTAIAVLRGTGAGRRTVTLVLLGAGCATVALGAVLGVALERWVLTPAAARLAADYAWLPLGGSWTQIAAVCAGLFAMAGCAAAMVVRRVEREPIAAVLREP